ncbi:hypothetical protein AB0F91_46025 [Amycolatopsis sp. NPDC023774]|uniref:hypothetical protein n=1 Tax=Amycolatopsis sp. NPDC023774 TaxID=3155015 RepID=UPI00340352A4
MNSAYEDGRLISVECGNCGREVLYAGTGRPPKFCSRSCRQRGYELRRAAQALQGGHDPRPATVREVREREVVRVERVVERHETVRPVVEYRPHMPSRGYARATYLYQLERQAREDVQSLVNDPGELDALATALMAAVRALSDAFPPHDSALPPVDEPVDERQRHQPPDSAGPAPLTRQQRRARDRAQRKRHH